MRREGRRSVIRGAIAIVIALWMTGTEPADAAGFPACTELLRLAVADPAPEAAVTASRDTLYARTASDTALSIDCRSGVTKSVFVPAGVVVRELARFQRRGGGDERYVLGVTEFGLVLAFPLSDLHPIDRSTLLVFAAGPAALDLCALPGAAGAASCPGRPGYLIGDLAAAPETVRRAVAAAGATVGHGALGRAASCADGLPLAAAGDRGLDARSPLPRVAGGPLLCPARGAPRAPADALPDSGLRVVTLDTATRLMDRVAWRTALFRDSADFAAALRRLDDETVARDGDRIDPIWRKDCGRARAIPRQQFRSIRPRSLFGRTAPEADAGVRKGAAPPAADPSRAEEMVFVFGQVIRMDDPPRVALADIRLHVRCDGKGMPEQAVRSAVEHPLFGDRTVTIEAGPFSRRYGPLLREAGYRYREDFVKTISLFAGYALDIKSVDELTAWRRALRLNYLEDPVVGAAAETHGVSRAFLADHIAHLLMASVFDFRIAPPARLNRLPAPPPKR